MKPNRTEHPFYDHKKKCRKTAWQTPEHLTPEDRQTLAALVNVLTANEPGGLAGLLRTLPETARAGLFNRVLGWPEGSHYCHSGEFCRLTAQPGLIKHQLADLRAALACIKGGAI